MTIESGKPAPVTSDANSRAMEREDAAEKWIAERLQRLTDAWLAHGDPYAFGGTLGETGADVQAGARRHWPELWSAYRQLAIARDRVSALIGNERARRKL
jgi:hypothetical protein